MIKTKHITSDNEWQHSLMQILHQASDLIFLTDEDGHVYQPNASMELWFQQNGIDQSQRLFSIFPTLNLLQWRRVYRSLQDQLPQYLELPLSCREQKDEGVLCSSWLVRLPDRGLVCWMVNCPKKAAARVSYTDNKEGSKTADELTRLTYQTINQGRDLVCWTREDGSIFYANEAFWETLSYSEKEVYEKHLYDFFPAYTREQFLDGWHRLKAGETLKGTDLLIAHRDGTQIPIENYATLTEYEGAPCCVTVMRNLTEQKKKEEALSKALHRIKQLNKELTKNHFIRKEDIAITSNFEAIISEDPAYRKVLKNVEQVAPTNTTVLITGETGTGKELLAKSIHQLSGRADEPFVVINGGALPEHLMESELFGHEKGAFTGAHATKEGKFELAHGGTIFLDEIGELSMNLQVKLLRVLQEQEFERVGGTKTIRTDVRILAATHRNLEQMVADGRFREDLYYRLNVFPIYNLPLRDRKQDIPLLFRFFLEKYSRKAGKTITEIPCYVIEDLTNYAFPGNVRELENLVERATILAQDHVLRMDTSKLRQGNRKTDTNGLLSMDDMQREHILQALKLAKGKVSGGKGAAAILRMNPKTLHSRMGKLGLNSDSFLLYEK